MSKCCVTKIALILIVFGGVALSTACAGETPDAKVPRDAIKPIITTVTGAVCPILEDEIYTSPPKEIFSECDLRKNPQRFDGRYVRIESGYAFMIHGPYLTDPVPCPGISRSVDEAVWVGFRSESDYDYVDRSGRFLNIRAVGKFSLAKPSRESDTIYDNTSCRFEIVCLERAAKPAL